MTIKVQRVAFGLQPHDRLLPVSVVPFTLYRHYPKKNILGIFHLRPCTTFDFEVTAAHL